jgi:hypothetical protein
MMVCSTGAGSASATERDAAVVEVAQELLERGHELAANRTAQAPAREQHHVVRDRLDQQMVEADVAELVDQHGGTGERRVAQQPVEQRGFAGTEEAGKDGQRDWRGRQTPRARRRHLFVPLAIRDLAWRLVWRRRSRPASSRPPPPAWAWPQPVSAPAR